MSDKLNITGFKCFEQASFDLNKLTVLCGSNGSGKSSVLQSLLLARASIEKNSILKEGAYDLSVWNNTSTSLNGEYELALGILDEIVREGNTSIEIGELLFELDTEHLSNDCVFIRYIKNPVTKTCFITQKEFYYLNAERIGPRYISECKSGSYPSCGHKGENTAQVLSFCEKTYKVPQERIIKHGDPDNFRIQVDRWLDYVCPGISIIVEPTGNLNSQIKIRNGNLNNISSAATNIGFGLSYLLPIIVTGLIAKNGSTFIIENPEAHLHPKAQSNLGFFLGKMAGGGIKIIIETHSEHIVNGIRRACLSKDTKITNTDVNIYFFDIENSDIDHDRNHLSTLQRKLKYDLIRIESNGDLSSFPKDFFDQTRQDLLEIIKLSRENG